MRRTPTLFVVSGLVTATAVSGCVGQYKSDFSVVVINKAANTIQVLANGNDLGQVAAGQTGSFRVRLPETNPNEFINGVAPTPQAQITVSAKDLKTGGLSIAKSMTLSQSGPTSVTFSAADFPGSVATVARFTFFPATPGLNEEVTFSASSSTASGGTFTWDFGDGGSGASVIVTHQYARTGTFNVTLTVTGDTGQSSTTSRITVSTTSPQVVARFTFSPATPDTNQDVFFNAWASTPSNGSFAWSFGDGSRGAGDTATYRYSQRGTYTVALTVTNDVGQSSTTTRTITVRPPDPYGDVVETCRGERHASLVACVNSFIHGHDEKSDLEVVKRVAWILKLEGEDGGLLVKPGGDNIWSWQSYSFSTSRVCTPLSWIWKIFADAGRGGANTPIWTDNGPTSETGSFCVSAMDPTLP